MHAAMHCAVSVEAYFDTAVSYNAKMPIALARGACIIKYFTAVINYVI
jgi:hypothetical protein